MYKTEYTLNKYAYAYTPSEQVHWASCFPPSWAEYAQPLMNPREFEVRMMSSRRPVGKMLALSVTYTVC